jgi:hypothetical protein
MQFVVKMIFNLVNLEDRSCNCNRFGFVKWRTNSEQRKVYSTFSNS